MATLRFQERAFPLEPGESVLDCLLRNSQPIAHSCKAGLCQSCLVQAVEGQPPARATTALKSTLQASGHALACQWTPDADICVRLPDTDGLVVDARIKAVEPLNASVMKLLVTADDTALLRDSHAGQYLNLTNADGVTRSYSIANLPARDGHYEFHIAATAQGLFSNWVFNRAAAGEPMQLRGPNGNCFYVPFGERMQPLLLVGTGTGLAPLYGILHDALAQGHKGPITLLHASTRPSMLYYRDELAAMAQQHANVRYLAMVLEGPADARCQQGDAIPVALQQLDPATIGDTRLYLCGNPAFVGSLRKQAFLKGVKSSNIYSDPFIERPVTPAA